MTYMYWVFWQDIPVGVLRRGYAGEYYFYWTTEGHDLPQNLRPLEFAELGRVYESPTLFHTFAKRVPSKRRPDYEKMARRWNVSNTDDPFEWLAGTRVNDPFELRRTYNG